MRGVLRNFQSGELIPDQPRSKVRCRFIRGMNQMNTAGRFRRMHCICSLLARVGLILSLWQAPIPWLHSHGTDLEPSSSARLISELRDHLDTFHRPFEINSEEDFGWHCHWIIPSWFHTSDDAADEQRPCREYATFDSLIPSTLASDSLEIPLLAALPEPATLRHSGHFECHLRLAPTTSLPSLWTHLPTGLRC